MPNSFTSFNSTGSIIWVWSGGIGNVRNHIILSWTVSRKSKVLEWATSHFNVFEPRAGRYQMLDTALYRTLEHLNVFWIRCFTSNVMPPIYQKVQAAMLMMTNTVMKNISSIIPRNKGATHISNYFYGKFKFAKLLRGNRENLLILGLYREYVYGTRLVSEQQNGFHFLFRLVKISFFCPSWPLVACTSKLIAKDCRF